MKVSHFKFSITSQIHRPFLWLLLDLKLVNMGRNLKQSFEIPILTRELYIFYKERSVFRHGSQVVCEIFFVWIQRSEDQSSSQKLYLRLYLTQIIHSHGKMLFSGRKLCLQSFYDAPFTLSYFLLQGKVVFRTRQQVACEMFICRKRSEHLVEKKKKSLVVFDSNCSFKTVKCSFFNQIIVYQSFYGAPLRFNYVLLQGKVLCFPRVGKSLVRCLLSEAADQTWWKKLDLRSYLTQIVHSNGKKLFLRTNNC